MRRKIYCAGPLFNPKEREEMQEIAEIVESCNVATFLPQRDGVKYADLIEKFRNNDLSNEEADKILKKVIAELQSKTGKRAYSNFKKLNFNPLLS